MAEKYPEIIRKNEGTETEFLFWFEKVVGKDEKVKRLMISGPNGFSEKIPNKIEQKKKIPVYAPLYNDNTCIRIGFA